MTPSRPAHAMRSAAALLTVAIAWRIPAIDHEFAAALAVVERMRPSTSRPDALATIAPVQPRAAEIADATSVALPRRRSTILRRLRLSTAPTRNLATEPLEAASIAAPTGSTADQATVALILVLPPNATAAEPIGAFNLATAAYARLAAGDRRDAVGLFDAAIAVGDPRSARWQAQRDALTRRWSANAYSIIRRGNTPATPVTPLLGGGQSGGGIAFTPDPLATRTIDLTLRGTVAHDDDGRSSFAAVGVQWRPIRGVLVAAERIVAIGPAARDAWPARVAAGGDRRFGPVRAIAYAEAGVIGSAGYAAGQATLGPQFREGGVTIVPGVGGWSSVQRDRGHSVDRVDLGPGITARAGPLAVAIDYRIRVAGNAAPGSGPVLTLSGGF